MLLYETTHDETLFSTYGPFVFVPKTTKSSHKIDYYFLSTTTTTTTMNTTDDETSGLTSPQTNMAPPTTTLAKSKKGLVVLVALCMLFFYTGRLSSSTSGGGGGSASLDASFLRGFQHDVVGVFPCGPGTACPETCNAIVTACPKETADCHTEGEPCTGLLTTVSEHCGCASTIDCARNLVDSWVRAGGTKTAAINNGIACILENWNAK